MAPRRVISGTNETKYPSNLTTTGTTSAGASLRSAELRVSEWLSTAKEFDYNNYLDAIVRLSGVSAAEIMGDRRVPQIVKARHLFYACVRHIGKWSYPQIAELACRDHTTIMHAVKRVDPAIVADVERIVKATRRGTFSQG